jgi:hypothetical protein
MNYKHVVALALIGASALASAQEKKSGDFYVEAGYLHGNFDISGDVDDDFGAGILKFGYNAHENLAIEVMGATGFSKAKKYGISVDLSHAFGIYAKPKVVLGDAEVFARIGYTDLKAKASGYGYSESDSDGDVSFGVGISYSFAKNVYGQIDYMRYYDRQGTEVGGPSVSIGFKF